MVKLLQYILVFFEAVLYGISNVRKWMNCSPVVFHCNFYDYPIAKSVPSKKVTTQRRNRWKKQEFNEEGYTSGSGEEK